MTRVGKVLTAAAAAVVMVIIGLVVVILRQGGDDEVASAGTTTSLAPPTTAASPTTTTAPPTTTTTTAPPTTTTTAPPTTTSSTTTTTAPTTTTTAPPVTERVFELSLGDADFEPRATNEARADRASGVVSVRAVSDGLDPGSQARATLRWRIEPDALAELGDAPQVGVLLDPRWDVTLDTGRNRGRSARADLQLTGTFGGASIGSGTDARAIGDGDRLSTVVTDVIGFGAPAPPGGGGLNVELVVTCTAQPGETVFQIGEESLCEVALTGVVSVTVRRAGS